jgi:hypothetical protein
VNNSNRFLKGSSNLRSAADEAESEIPKPITNMNDILLDMISVEPKKPKGKALSIYLSSEVITALEDICATKNISKSKLIESVLRKLLIG